MYVVFLFQFVFTMVFCFFVVLPYQKAIWLVFFEDVFLANTFVVVS